MISDARGSHVSPGIYTEERDVTYSVKSLGITSLGLVGETLYGPAFQNIEIESWGDYVDYFGGTSTEKFKGTGMPKYELPYIAKSYLEESKRLNVVRVLGLSGYEAGPAWVIKDNDKVIAVLRSKMDYNKYESDICNDSSDNAIARIDDIELGTYEETINNSICPNGTSSSNVVNVDVVKFSIIVKKNSENIAVYNVTLNPNDSNYIYKVLGNSPDSGSALIYVEAVYENSISSPTSAHTPSLKITKCDDNGKYSNFKTAYKFAMTPWIVSNAIVANNTIETTQDENGNTKQPIVSMRKLFRFSTISDGNIANYQVKVSLQNINPGNGTFDVVVRDFNDTDANPVILEKFTKCNLVEGDINYIAFRIGSTDGGYEAKSKYILVEMADNMDLSESFPAGFLGYPMPDYDNSDFEMVYNNAYRPEIKSKRQYFGMSNLAGKYGIDKDVLAFKGVEWYKEGPESLCNGFHMDSMVNGDNIMVDNVSGYKFTSVSTEKVTNAKYEPRFINSKIIEETIYNDVNLRKFTVCFYGGFDGWDVNREARTNTDNYKSTKYNSSGGVITNVIEANVGLPLTANTSDYYAYLAGYRVFANPQDVDINLFATPGIDWYNNSLLTEEVLDIIEDSDGGRGGDALYIMSSPNMTDAREVASIFEDVNINSSHACTYFPWVMYYDGSNKRYLDIPVTKDVVRNMASTDNNSFPWFAPAGMQRGNVDCIKAVFKTTLADEDALYEVGINPIKSYAQDGVKVWGNKTSYNMESPLNRINVRRLMIRVKKLINEAAKHLIFEQYDETLEAQFKGIVEPILADVKANRGIIDYRVITECTPETRDQHILPCKIMIKPTQSLEYISISFVVYPESVDFEN